MPSTLRTSLAFTCFIQHIVACARGSRLPAGQMLTLTTQLGCISRLFAVLAAVFAVGAAFRDDAGTRGMRALIWIGHGRPPLRLVLHKRCQRACCLRPRECPED